MNKKEYLNKYVEVQEIKEAMKTFMKMCFW